MAEKETIDGNLPAGATEIPEGLPVMTVRAPNMATLYVGNAGLAVGANDVRLFIGDQVLNSDGKSVLITQQLCLVFTPEYAKAVAENMVRGMTLYETKFGKLRNVVQKEAPTTE